MFSVNNNYNQYKLQYRDALYSLAFNYREEGHLFANIVGTAIYGNLGGIY